MNSVRSIIEFHRLLSLPEPQHPLVSVVHAEHIRFTNHSIWEHFFLDFYTVSLKKGVQAKVKYGQQHYDYAKGVMSFTAPKQVNAIDFSDSNTSDIANGTGYVLLLHPDFLYGHPIASTIKNYGFFSYAVNEALHLSAKEEKNILYVFQKIEQEYQYIDKHTQDILLAHIDLLLQYSNRFYERQFITRKKINHDLLTRIEILLNQYFEQEEGLKSGLPTVEFLAKKINVSPYYLSDMMRSATGQTTQQYIHDKLIEKAKEKLSTTNSSVSEIAYEIGFEYPQSFNKLFKKKVNISPLKYRQLFN